MCCNQHLIHDLGSIISFYFRKSLLSDVLRDYFQKKSRLLYYYLISRNTSSIPRPFIKTTVDKTPVNHAFSYFRERVTKNHIDSIFH